MYCLDQQGDAQQSLWIEHLADWATLEPGGRNDHNRRRRILHGVFHKRDRSWRFFTLMDHSLGTFLSFILPTWYVIHIDLWILNHLCILEINPTWLWCIIHLMYCWILFANISWEFFHECFSAILTIIFFFSSFFGNRFG